MQAYGNISNQAFGSTNYKISNSPTNLVTVTFGAGSIKPAVGVWNVYADSGYSDYYNNDSSYDANFKNGVSKLPVDASGNYLLGTVTVTGAPEPSTFALLGVGALLGVAGSLWRRRRAAEQVGV